MKNFGLLFLLVLSFQLPTSLALAAGCGDDPECNVGTEGTANAPMQGLTVSGFSCDVCPVFTTQSGLTQKTNPTDQQKNSLRDSTKTQ